MLDGPLRRAALFLFGAAIRVAPADTRDWGKAMLAELDHVRGSWAALIWAWGGAGVLGRHTLMSLIVPDRNKQPALLGGEIFAEEVFMRKRALVVGALCVGVALLLVFVPGFRQALKVSLFPWQQISNVSSMEEQSSLRKLAKRAEKGRDAEALAFVAARLSDARESARLADEAVQLNPDLTWLYGIVASRHAELPEVERWVDRLEQWDPQNALAYLIAAVHMDILHAIREDVPSWEKMRDDRWNEAMAAAFTATKFDLYLARQVDLDRKVVLRHHLFEPLVVLTGLEALGLPIYSCWDIDRYSKSLIKAGENFEAKGDLKRASRNYWTVARFGQLMDLQGQTDIEHFAARRIQPDAYQHLRAISEKEGNQNASAHFGYMAQHLQRQNRSVGQELTWLDFSLWNASVVQVSGLFTLVFAAVILVCALYAIARRSIGTPSARVNLLIWASGLVGAVGFLLSSVALYVSYRPYAEIFNRFILNGDVNQVRALSVFLGLARFPLGLDRLYETRLLELYFWYGVTTMCVIGLLLVGMRHVVSPARASASA